MSEIDPQFLDRILNSPDLDDATKAWEIAVANMPHVGMEEYVAAKAYQVEKLTEIDPNAAAAAEVAEYRKLKARNGAERRLAGEQYIGSEELSWDDLDALDGTFMVEDLVPDEAVVFLLAKRNYGKTFAYISMVCSMIYGEPWLGKKTRQAKVTIVIGEGVNGFKRRMVAWAEDRGYDPNEIPKWVSFVHGANLMSDESVRRIREVTERNKTELIIWDTWANVAGVPDSDKDMLVTNAMNSAMAVQPGATNLFVHHPRKAEEDSDKPVLRGSNALDGRADVVMTLYRDKKFNSPTPVKGRRWLAVSTEDDHGGKNRNAATETIRGCYLDECGNSAVFRQLAVESLTRESRLALETLGTAAMTVEEFETASGKSRATAYRYLKQAVADGTIVCNDGMYSAVEPKVNKYSAVQAVLDYMDE